MLPAQGVVWWITALKFVCGEALTFSMRRLCYGDTPVLSAQGVVQQITTCDLLLMKLSRCLHEDCVVMMLLHFLRKAL